MINIFKKKRTLTVSDNSITVHQIDGEDYICLTDMARGEDGTDHIKNWMRNRNTIEFLGLWESMNNIDFKDVEFDTFRKAAGLNSFTLTPKKWTDATNAKGIISKSGRYGGTYAHKDIAFEFGTWISPAFKLYLIKDYQKLKELKSNEYNLEWDVKRLISKTNYQLHTDAIKEYILPASKRWKKEWEYAEEADILNLAIFGFKAKEWQKANPERHKAKENVRDSASINELIVLSNAENLNSEMIRDGLSKEERFNKLQEVVQRQLKTLDDRDFIKSIKKTSEDVYLIENQDRDKK